MKFIGSRVFKSFALSFLLSPAASLAQVQFEVSFEGRWTSDLPRPGSAHFSELVGTTHNSTGSLLGIGAMASSGIEGVAETGATGSLITEINAAIGTGNASSVITGGDTFISPEETNTFTITTDADHPLFTLVTMIAPSPDWFVGVHDLELMNPDGTWKTSIILDLNSYDAGTENGSGLSLNNTATNPQGVIQMLDAAEPSGALFGAGSIARLTITQIPEPSTVLLALGAGLLGLRRRRV